MIFKAVLFTSLLALAQAAPVAHQVTGDGVSHRASKRTNACYVISILNAVTEPLSDLPSTTEV